MGCCKASQNASISRSMGCSLGIIFFFLQGHYQVSTSNASLNNPVKITCNVLIKNIFSIK